MHQVSETQAPSWRHNLLEYARANGLRLPAKGRFQKATLAGVGVVLLALASAFDGALAAEAKAPTARAASVIPVRDSSELHLVKAVGNTLSEEGQVTGTLPGTVNTQLDIDVETGSATSSFTFHLRGGLLRGHASGTATAGHGGWESFSGTMLLTRGTGRYAHASGSGKMYGALYRRNDRLKVQAIGSLRY